ncbi:MAG: Uma2 family endonuclease [Myxococcales bacterium]|nr:Uma2 family endonuclease [Myxococcales bacterium]
MSLAQKLGRPATHADLEALPPGLKGEILDGELFVQPRPRARHANIELLIGSDVGGPYQRGRGGPGGWWILVEPGIELPGAPEVAPDLAGWRRESLPALPADEPIRVVPEWVCEILSPASRGYDQLKKRPFYARAGVRWLWYVDPEAHTLTASRLVAGQWLEVGVFGDEEKVRVEPFDVAELDLAEWWQAGA